MIERRDRFVYPTNADYISAAVLAFEGEFQFCPFEGNKEDEFIDKLVGRLEDWRNSRRYGG